MTRARLLGLALALLLLLAGCGGGGEEEGSASLWITRDRGTRVLFRGEVPAGLTVMQALRREADVDTRYGGRFVQAIDGVEGSLDKGRDWFYFVNGVSADRGAAEYRLHGGDIAWWDFRAWVGEPEVDIVVGAFPEPFLHGYAGHTRPAHVRYSATGDEAAALRLARMIGAATVTTTTTPVPPGANVLRIVPGRPDLRATRESPEGPYVFTLSGRPERLARNPESVRFRYEGLR